VRDVGLVDFVVDGEKSISSRSAPTRRNRYGRESAGDLVEQSPVENSDASTRLQLDRSEPLQMPECSCRDLADGSYHRGQIMMGRQRDDGVHRRLPSYHAGDSRHDVLERQLTGERAQRALAWHEKDDTALHRLGVGDGRLAIECGGVAEGFTDGEVVEVLLPAFCGALEDPHIAAGDEVQPLRLVALGVDQGAPIVRACDHPRADRGKNSRRERREIWMPAEDRERICHETRGGVIATTVTSEMRPEASGED
jgi:hypothetical protein